MTPIRGNYLRWIIALAALAGVIVLISVLAQ